MSLWQNIRTKIITAWRVLTGDRMDAFIRYLLKRFMEDKCFKSAGALAYTTVVSLVPLTAVTFGVMSMFPVFDQWKMQITNFLFQNFVPQSARVIEQYLLGYADTATKLTAIGGVVLFFSALIMMKSIEDTYNHIWRVSKYRHFLSRLLIYWAALTMGPILAVAAVATGSYAFAIAQKAGEGVLEGALGWLPIILQMVLFTCSYKIIPNRRVAWGHAIIGGLLATVLFEGVKYGMALYVQSVPSYKQVYGAVAAIPIFLLWLYASWSAVLLGASLAASLASFRFQPKSLRLPEGHEIYAVLRMLGRFSEAQQEGKGLSTEAMLRLEPVLTDDLMMSVLERLQDMNVLTKNDEGDWLLARDLDHLLFRELYTHLKLRIPVNAATLPMHDDALGQQAVAALEAWREANQALLAQPVAKIISAMR